MCRWFNSTSGHRLIISDISILSYIILVWFEELNKFYKVLQAEYWAINPQPSSTLVLQNSSTPTTPMGYPPYFVFLRERQSPEKNQATNFTRICDFTWRVSDCEELVGFTWGWNNSEMWKGCYGWWKRKKMVKWYFKQCEKSFNTEIIKMYSSVKMIIV